MYSISPHLIHFALLFYVMLNVIFPGGLFKFLGYAGSTEVIIAFKAGVPKILRKFVFLTLKDTEKIIRRFSHTTCILNMASKAIFTSSNHA
jgi:hypothetical protein